MKSEITDSEFEQNCLAIFDDVAATGRVVITRQGKPVAMVVPIDARPSLEGSVTILGDIVSPAVDPDEWEINRD